MGNNNQKNEKSKKNNINIVDKDIKDNSNNNNSLNNINNNLKKFICKYYILFVGSKGIGTKTSLIKRIEEGIFVEKSKEINEKLIYEKDNKEFVLYLIDDKADIKNEKLDNSEKYAINVVKENYSNADCIVMGYDVTNKQSFEEIKE